MKVEQIIVSLIVPIFNGQNYIESLVSLLDRINFKNLEVVFIDNNSIDNSISELKKHLSNCNFKYQILQEKKQGAGNARNKGIAFSKGKYITFLDCDDKIDVKKIEYDVTFLEKYNVDFVFCRTVRYYENGRIVKHPIKGFREGVNKPSSLGLIWLNNYFYIQGTGAIMIKKDVLQQLGGFHSMKSGEDSFLFIKLGLLYNGYFYNEELFFYYRHANSIVSNINKEKNGILLSYFNLRKKLFNDIDVFNNHKARSMLIKQLNIDLLQLQNKRYDIQTLFDDEELKKFKRNSFLFNKFSLWINKNVRAIKYNPFYQIWIRTYMS